MLAYVQMKLMLHLKTATSDAFSDPLVWDNSVEVVARFLPISGCCHVPEGQKDPYPSGCIHKVPYGLADADSGNVPCMSLWKVAKLSYMSVQTAPERDLSSSGQ